MLKQIRCSKFSNFQVAILLSVLLVCVLGLAGCGNISSNNSGNALTSLFEKKIQLKTIIIPKMEFGTFDDGNIGEAEYIYKDLMGTPEQYTISSGPTVYVNGEVAMFIAGQGKTDAATHLTSLLSDKRFDCSCAYIVSVGCAGGAYEKSTIGDVTLASATVDLDLGHTADYRDLQDKSSEKTFFFDETLKDIGCKKLNSSNIDKIYNKAKSLELKSSDSTKSYINSILPGEAWAQRPPMVLKGTHVTSDNYWKGQYYEANANYATSGYSCSDPFTTTEMEDHAIAQVADSFDMLDRVFAVRGIVNTDRFPSGETPETLWGPSKSYSSEWYDEAFKETMRNMTDVVETIVDSINDGSLAGN